MTPAQAQAYLRVHQDWKNTENSLTTAVDDDKISDSTIAYLERRVETKREELEAMAMDLLVESTVTEAMKVLK